MPSSLSSLFGTHSRPGPGGMTASVLACSCPSHGHMIFPFRRRRSYIPLGPYNVSVQGTIGREGRPGRKRCTAGRQASYIGQASMPDEFPFSTLLATSSRGFQLSLASIASSFRHPIPTRSRSDIKPGAHLLNPLPLLAIPYLHPLEEVIKVSTDPVHSAWQPVQPHLALAYQRTPWLQWSLGLGATISSLLRSGTERPFGDSGDRPVGHESSALPHSSKLCSDRSG